MRLDANNAADRGYALYDAKRCCSPKHVSWVDDQLAQWGRVNFAESVRRNEVVIDTIQEDRITIYPNRKLVIFNEIDDGEFQSIKDSREVAA